jgi:hypothetical protein
MEREVPAFQVADDFDGIQYDTPSRAEQALAEWERKSWLAGPVVKFHYRVTPEGRIGLILDNVRHLGGAFITHTLSKEDRAKIVQRLADEHAKRNRIPDPEELAADLDMVATLRREWGPKWFLHSPVNPGMNPHPFEMPDIDDPYRYSFYDEDTRSKNLGSVQPLILSHELDDDEMERKFQTIVTSAMGEEVALSVEDDDLYSNLDADGVGDRTVGISGR